MSEFLNKKMNQQIKQDILAVLNKAISLINEEMYVSLSELSNHVIHNASIYQDHDSLSIAVLMYSLYKLFTKYSLKKHKVVSLLKKASSTLKEGKIKSFRTYISTLFKLIETIDKDFNNYVEQVEEKARIKKAVKIYDHGISLARVAEILNITQWELLNYLGNIKPEPEKISRNNKLKIAEKIFGLRK